MTNIKENDKIYQIEYDNYGNIINDGKGTLEYDERNQLKKYKYCIDEGQCYHQYENEYYYNYQGIRYKKKVSHSIRYGNNEEKIYEYFKIYYLDGNRIIKEEWRNLENQITNEIMYYYDIEGLVGIEYQGKKYNIVKDILGNVSKIMYKNRIIGEYEYDGWGKCVEKELSPEKNTEIDTFVLHNNPFRYRGYYYDVETGLAMVGQRYYSPKLCRFIQPADVSSLNPRSINGLNLYAYANNNPVGIAYSGSSAAFGATGGMVSSLALGGLTSVGGHLSGSAGLSIKFPSQNWVSLGMDLTASMAGAFSVLKWTMNNPEFYEFWYSAWGLSEHQVLSNLKSPMTKIASAVSYGLVAYDTYTDVAGHIKAGDSWQKTTASGMVTAGVGAFNVWASAKVGAAIGGYIGGVPGFLIGTAAGVVVGIVINGIFYTEINGKSIAGHIEDGIEWFLEWIS